MEVYIYYFRVRMCVYVAWVSARLALKCNDPVYIVVATVLSQLKPGIYLIHYTVTFISTSHFFILLGYNTP